MPREGLGPSRRSTPSAPPAASRRSPTSARRPTRIGVLQELVEAGLGGLEVYYRSFDAATVEAVGEVATTLGLVATGGTDYHGDVDTVRRRPRAAVGPARGRRWRSGRPSGQARRQTDDRAPRPRPRAADPRDRPAGAGRAPRAPAAPADARLGEYLPEARRLPRFHVWTLGCQMNRSDSEEMAGRLLAAGCAEAPAFEAADLIVINTCAIREGAEQKVIGRQGQLAAPQGRQPGRCGSC